jgi:hypothetical protein
MPSGRMDLDRKYTEPARSLGAQAHSGRHSPEIGIVASMPLAA